MLCVENGETHIGVARLLSEAEAKQHAALLANLLKNSFNLQTRDA